MGIMSKIKKAGKSLLKGVKKGFKSALGKVAKVLNNKYVKIALLVVSLVVPVVGMATQGWAQAAAQGAGMMGKIGGALSNVARGVASMVVNAVTTPIKAVMNAGAKGASLFNANGLAATLSNGAKVVGNASTSLFGTVKADSLSQIVGRWNGTAAQASGAAANTAAGLGTADAAASAASTAAPATAQATAQATDTVAKFGDLASKVSADGALTSAGQAASGSGGMMQTAGGLLKKTAGFINQNPEVAKMAFGAVSSAMAPDEADLLKQQYKYENKWREDRGREWDEFNPNANNMATQAASQYGQAAEGQMKPYDWRARAAEARAHLSQPLLKRTYAGAY